MSYFDPKPRPKARAGLPSLLGETLVGWTHMTLDLNCRRCDGPVRVELSDLATSGDRQARWSCPRCHASNLVPVLARVASVEKIQS